MWFMQQTLVLCADNEPATRCANCELGYTDKQMDTISRMLNLARPFKCVRCSHTHNNVTDFAVWVRDDSAKFLNTQTVRDTLWYHGTHAANWHEAMVSGGDIFHHSYGTGDIMVHIGTEQAARERVYHRKEQLKSRREADYYSWCLFTLRIRPDAPILDELQKDWDFFPETNNDDSADEWFDFEPEGVTKYLNAFENPGSISLLANINALEIVEVKPLM